MVAAVLFAFLLNWRTTAISLTAIPVSILATAAIFLFRRTVDQHDDAGRIGDRHRRTGRRCGRGRREHLPPSARKPRSRKPQADFRRGGVRIAGGALRHRLRDDDHRAGVRAAVRAVGHRRPAVHAARRGLHHFHSREPRRLDHADAGHGVLHAAGLEGARRPGQRVGPGAQALQSRPSGLILPVPAHRHFDDRGCGAGCGSGRISASARVPAALQRRHLHHQPRVQSRHLARRIHPRRPHRRAA